MNKITRLALVALPLALAGCASGQTPASVVTGVLGAVGSPQGQVAIQTAFCVISDLVGNQTKVKVAAGQICNGTLIPVVAAGTPVVAPAVAPAQ